MAQEELFLMDSYYKELMQKERQAFERILASKLNVQEREVERKLQKQIKESQVRLQKAQALEARYFDS